MTCIPTRRDRTGYAPSYVDLGALTPLAREPSEEEGAAAVVGSTPLPPRPAGEDGGDDAGPHADNDTTTAACKLLPVVPPLCSQPDEDPIQAPPGRPQSPSRITHTDRTAIPTDHPSSNHRDDAIVVPHFALATLLAALDVDLDDHDDRCHDDVGCSSSSSSFASSSSSASDPFSDDATPAGGGVRPSHDNRNLGDVHPRPIESPLTEQHHHQLPESPWYDMACRLAGRSLDPDIFDNYYASHDSVACNRASDLPVIAYCVSDLADAQRAEVEWIAGRDGGGEKGGRVIFLPDSLPMSAHPHPLASCCFDPPPAPVLPLRLPLSRRELTQFDEDACRARIAAGGSVAPNVAPNAAPPPPPPPAVHRGDAASLLTQWPRRGPADVANAQAIDQAPPSSFGRAAPHGALLRWLFDKNPARLHDAKDSLMDAARLADEEAPRATGAALPPTPPTAAPPPEPIRVALMRLRAARAALAMSYLA